ncbi:MAG TPA: bifunctional folylpolyglutamate synthase/dihydrofolate synthase [Candidatus Pelagibacter bacterium]|jgi:dihydrofolate synthase/folylpolyglutamate synthase|nr:bifunctional folylpolyglutamate synthase/dihydrofolate synthase [Pelagibacteraceae bacterium]HJN84419.1 bifunctional folylpolyglutamate synthase/dihydrofolate synthase [Candidatus Pelagibacter bacterium]|tara:strand:- start:8092 stop:9357 length:1266 start_codon:yes stop_codon:yes gene_type:complete
MKLQKLISKLQQKHHKKLDLSLGRTFNLLNKLGNPQDRLNNVISVVGTNSKYSICQSLKAILNQSGYKCNLYLSPHLQSYTERFVFNDKEISEEILISLLEDVEKTLGDGQATLFEILTCTYLKYCEQFKNNITLIEAGLFHQFDSTNVFKKNLASIIGSVGLDHLQWIQNKTIEGIIHEKTVNLLNSNIFVNKQDDKKITSKIENALSNNQSKKYFFGKDFNILKAENSFIQYEDNEGSIILPEPNILGNHQLLNISTSIATSRKLFNTKDKDIKNAIIKIDLKGRLQEIKSGKLKKIIGSNRLICDGGHNINAAKAIANWIKQQNQDVHLIIGMMKDKDHRGFIKCLKNNVKSITLIDIPNQEGSISKEDFKNKLNGIKEKINLNNSIEESIQLINKYQNNICLIVGSLYLVGEVLNLN